MSELIEITPTTLPVDIRLAYATFNNFTGEIIYRNPVCYLHRDAFVCLERAVRLAAAIDCRLRILDAFRPAEAQWRLWSHCPDPEYIADPKRGSPHSMGAAVDVTLIDAASGQALDMGSAFDDLRPVSWHGNTDISGAAQRNRHVLLGLMSAAGFDFYQREWWHYQLFKPRGRYPVLSDTILPRRMMI